MATENLTKLYIAVCFLLAAVIASFAQGLVINIAIFVTIFVPTAYFGAKFIVKEINSREGE